MLYKTAGLLSLLTCASGKFLETGVKPPSSWLFQEEANGKSLIELTFVLKLQNTATLHDKLMEVSSPSSPHYGKLLSYEEVNQLTNPSDKAVNDVVQYLSSYGIEEIHHAPGFIRASVNISVAERLLSAKYHSFKHTKSGEVTMRTSAYSLPDSVAQHVAFVAPTVNFPQTMRITATNKVGALNQNTPDGLRTLYNVNDATGGKSSARQAVTAFLHQYYEETDLQTFYDEYYPDLSGVPISNVVGPNGEEGGIEAALDVEYMTTLGAGVSTEFWSFPGRQPDAPLNEPFLDWLYMLSDTSDPPLVFSTSYGEDETSVSLDYAERMNEEFQKNALRGVSFLFASGDSGVGSMSGSCVEFMPMYPADSPYVTAVGATTQTNPETGASLSSGGFSNRWARPSWQDEAVEYYLATASNLPSSALYNASGRGFPDVSAQGTGYVVINNGQTYPAVAGTSASSPTFAGIIALINDARIASGKSSMGFLNPFIYENPDIFNDITSGNNPGCSTDGFYASAGWDPITGNGTPNYEKMVEVALSLP